MFTITLDNASNNKAACDLLRESGKHDMLFDGQHLLVRCCAHILNILVQDGMDVASAAIELIRDLIRHVNSGGSRIQPFNEIAERERLARKAGLLLDVPNRWNSTHDMIVEAVNYKNVIKRYANAQLQPLPSDDEWHQAESVAEFLGVFEEATRAFSADRFPSSHQALRSPIWHKDDIIVNLAKAMDKKFDKYWDGNYNMALIICTILDPRRKLDFLDFFYEKVCKTFDEVEERKKETKDWLGKYFKKYQELIRRNGTNAVPEADVSTSLVNRSPVLLLGKRRIQQEFARYRSQRRGVRVGKSELDAYLEEDPVREDEKFEILSWWKTNSNKYPVLSAMARDFLAIPLSTVSSESAFSLGGHILSDNRSSMTPETLEALVCCKDWLYKYPTNGDN
ncbi:unnamed protein product [Urochloa humidicola]